MRTTQTPSLAVIARSVTTGGHIGSPDTRQDILAVTLDGISDISPGDQVKKRKQVMIRTDRANRDAPAMRPHSPGATLNWLICGVNGTLVMLPARGRWLIPLG